MREAKDKTPAEREAMAEKEGGGDDGAQTPSAPDIEADLTSFPTDEGGDTESIVEDLDDDLLSDGHWHVLPPSDLVTFQLATEPSDGENFLFHGGGAAFNALYLAPISEYFSGMFEELGPMPPTELISAEALHIQHTHYLVQQTASCHRDGHRHRRQRRPGDQ